MQQLCDCGCGEQLSEKDVNSGRATKWGHGAKAVSGELKKKQAKAKKKTAKPILAELGEDETKEETPSATLVFTCSHLDRMFIGMPLADKVACIQGWLDRIV
jgi:hypothetical protein